MSGIAGIVYTDGRPAEQSLSLMMRAMEHRGPDGSGSWADGPVALGHLMLHTTPESLQEKLPFRVNRSDLVVTADARIDNRAELLGLLRLEGRDIPDSSLILFAYEKWGEECVDHLLGDFAFAVWDGRRQELFCARDHMGVKPFYYHRSSRALFFASELKGILAIDEVPRKVNEAKVAEFLQSTCEDKESTFYEEILRLPPAHALIVKRDGIKKEQYWFLDPEREIQLHSDQEYADQFREIFTEAVRCRLRSAYPLGAFLSGGLDSSSIVCMAKRLLDGSIDLHTFSSTFPEVPRSDEREYIEAVLQQNGVQPHFVRGDTLDPLGSLEELLRNHGEPFLTYNLFLSHAMYRAIGETRVRVVLDGIDGDTTVSHGIGRLADLATRLRWFELAREALSLSQRLERPVLNLLLQRVLKPLLPHSPESAIRKFRTMAQILGREFRERKHESLTQPGAAQTRLRCQGYSSRDHHERLSQGMIPHVLETMDCLTSHIGVEPRYPFFDKRLVEYCLSLPAEQKLKEGWTRIVLRRAMKGVLPVQVQWRPSKADLGPNFFQALRRRQGKGRRHFVESSPSSHRGPKVSHPHSLKEDAEETQLLTNWRTQIFDHWLASNHDDNGRNEHPFKRRNE